MLRRHGSPDEPIAVDRGSSANRIVIRLDASATSIIALIVAIAVGTWLAADRRHVESSLTRERTAVRELLARDHEYQMKELDATKRKFDLLDSDWMQMNAYLAANGVTKDAGGFYVQNGSRLQEIKSHER